jgi:hypothetical protein
VNSRYFKHGSGVRLELRGRERGEIVFREGGEAWEQDGAFFCRSIAFDGEMMGAVDLPRRLWALLEDLPVTVERATLVLGVSLHRYEEGDEKTSWREETARLHLALANRSSGVRCVVERGCATGSELWLEEILRIGRTLAKAERVAVVTQGPIVLDPAITAALVSALILSGGPLPADPPLVQSPRPNERDGRGRPLELRPIGGAGRDGRKGAPPGAWESVYRPSYRTRPVPLPFGVDLDRELAGAVEGNAMAIALSGEIELTRRALRAPLLIEDETGHVGESIVELRREQLDRAIVAVGRERTWYPYLAGVWGRPLLLDPHRIT